jgi:hypothetical protein
MKNLKLIFVAMLAVLTVSCKSKTNNTDPAAGANGQATEVVVEIKYYRGGWYGPQPNWSHDMKIDFLQYSNGQYQVTAKHTDSLCFKTGGITVSEVNDLFTVYQQILLLTSTGVTLPDLGNEYVEIKTQSGVTRKYHLLNGNVPSGEQYITNPQALRDFMQDLEDSLATACI